MLTPDSLFLELVDRLTKYKTHSICSNTCSYSFLDHLKTVLGQLLNVFVLTTDFDEAVCKTKLCNETDTTVLTLLHINLCSTTSDEVLKLQVSIVLC